jgi:hypothetical protein
MKTTKHIEKLAQKINNEKGTEYEQMRLDYLTQELTLIKNALFNGNFYAGVVSVSRSGMSRKIKLAYTYTNKLIRISQPEILKLAGVGINGSIPGGGMDMLFHAQYTLFMNLHTSYKRANYQRRMKQYNNI